tara:strand:- start:34037 stop:35062 length:1026 start_codon:yes stop_codon:yes gene_type:complete
MSKATFFNKKKYFLSLKKKIKFHYKNCKEFKNLINNSNLKINNSKNIESLPFIHINNFKSNNLLSVSKKKVVTTLHSSGTTNSSKSKIFLDKSNVINQKKSLYNILCKSITSKRLPMIILDKNPSLIDKKLYSAKIAAIYGFSLIGRDYFYILNKNNSINYNGLKKFISKHKNSKKILFGFTYEVYDILINRLKIKNISLQNSVLIHGGGWKKMEQKKINNYEFKKKIKAKYNINKIINYYGLVEQTGSIFLECYKCNHLITNSYSDIIIRKPNLNLCKESEQGIVQILSSIPSSYPGNSIITEDLGLIKKNYCKYHQEYKSFLIKGRIKKVEVRGCSDAN